MTGEPFYSAYSDLEEPLRDLRRMAAIACYLVPDTAYLKRAPPTEDELELREFAVFEVMRRIEVIIKQWESDFDTARREAGMEPATAHVRRGL